jgi:hypothetical protein
MPQGKKPTKYDTRVYSVTPDHGRFHTFKNQQEAFKYAQKYKAYDPSTHGEWDTINTLENLRAADPEDGSYDFNVQTKKARAEGFPSFADKLIGTREGINAYQSKLPTRRDYGTTALSGSNGSYPNQGKMSKALGVKNTKAGM